VSLELVKIEFPVAGASGRSPRKRGSVQREATVRERGAQELGLRDWAASYLNGPLRRQVAGRARLAKMFAPSKKRPMMPAQSPMTRMTQELGDALPDTSSSPMDMAVGSQPVGSQHVYCTPDFGEGDFCTPVDQVHDLQWSQKENEEPVRPPCLSPLS